MELPININAFSTEWDENGNQATEGRIQLAWITYSWHCWSMQTLQSHIFVSLIVNFIHFREAFGIIHRHALWKILKQYGLPTKVITIMQKLWRELQFSQNWRWRYQPVTEVRQGCILLPLLLAIVKDWVLRKTTDNSAGGIMWEGDHLCDLDFADDIALIANSWSSMQQTSTTLTVEAGKVGLCTDPEKCKVLTIIGQTCRLQVQTFRKLTTSVTLLAYISQ